MEKKNTALDLRLAEQGRSITVSQADITDIQKSQKTYETQMNAMKGMLDAAKVEIDRLRENSHKLERASKRNNLRLIGVQETRDEKPIDIVKDILHRKFDMENVSIEAAFRVGPMPSAEGDNARVPPGAVGGAHREPPAGGRQRDRPRHIIVKLADFADKLTIFKNKRQALQNENYFFVDDLTDSDLQTKKQLQPVIDQAIKDKKKWTFRNGQLRIEGQLYRRPTGGPTEETPAR